MISLASQTDPYIEDSSYEESETIFFCWNGNNEASIQTFIKTEKDNNVSCEENLPKPITTKNKVHGPDVEMTWGFFEHPNINDN